MLNIVDPSICLWSETTYLIFSANTAGTFLYYSHLFPSISGLIIAIFVLRADIKNKAAQALLFTTSMFAVWCFLDLITWTSPRSDIIMFVWSTLMYFELLMYVGAFYFIYSFFNQKFPSFKTELAIFIMFLPLIVFGHTTLNLIGFDFTNCLRYASEGPLWQYYVYGFEFMFIGIISLLVVLEARKRTEKNKETILVTVGIISFLLLFSSGNIIGSFFDNWKVGQVGLFGMPIFVAFLGYILVQYQTFRVKLLATEALMAGQLLLLISLLFVRTIENAQIIAIITIVFFSLLGYLLIKSVRQEVEHRREIEKLATKLEGSNMKLKELDKMKSEFVSIASHQLRSPLTSIRGYTSMILEGSYGPLSAKLKDPIERINQSARFMASSVEDYLNVSRIQSGNMKYEYSDFNIVKITETIVESLRPLCIKKGLLLTFKTDLLKQGITHADIGKTRQVIDNLLNNALKYTPHGSIGVVIHDEPKTKRLYIDITDTGIGMSEHHLSTMFEKFARASNANEIDVDGTGLGLFIARRMAREMGGDVTATSDGTNKGSVFTIELPLAL